MFQPDAARQAVQDSAQRIAPVSRAPCVQRSLVRLNIDRMQLIPRSNRDQHTPHLPSAMKNHSNYRSLAVFAVVSTMLLSGCEDSNGELVADKPVADGVVGPGDLRHIFEHQGSFGGKQTILVLPMLEGEASLSLRARSLGVGVGSITPTAYGLCIYTLFAAPPVGAAVCKVERIYHLKSLPGQVTVDSTYFYCEGLLSTSVLKVTEKRWSEHSHAGAAEIDQLLQMADAVNRGSGHRAAHEALQPLGSLGRLGRGGARDESASKEMTWLAGLQRIEQVDVRIMPSPDYGNQLTTQFVRTRVSEDD